MNKADRSPIDLDALESRIWPRGTKRVCDAEALELIRELRTSRVEIEALRERAKVLEQQRDDARRDAVEWSDENDALREELGLLAQAIDDLEGVGA